MLSQVTLLAVAATLVAAGNPDKPEINPVIDIGKLNQGLLDHLPLVNNHISYYWSRDWIPQACKDLYEGHGLNVDDVDVINVHYDDCEADWVICRHRDANWSERDMIDHFGRIPGKMRSYVRHLIATPGLNDGNIAFTFNNGDTVVEDSVGMNILIHEISHSLDGHQRDDLPFPFSSNPQWQNEYAKDSHTPTAYGRNTWQEDYAETGPVAIFDKVVPGGFPSIQGNYRQIYNQFSTYQGWAGDTILPGRQCFRRFDNSQSVMRHPSKAKSIKTAKPDNIITNANITRIETDPARESEVIKCSFNKRR